MADPAGQISSQTDSLAPWAAPYVTEMLGRGEALASEPLYRIHRAANRRYFWVTRQVLSGNWGVKCTYRYGWV
jgi:hypothetical protein